MKNYIYIISVFLLLMPCILNASDPRNPDSDKKPIAQNDPCEETGNSKNGSITGNNKCIDISIQIGSFAYELNNNSIFLRIYKEGPSIETATRKSLFLSSPLSFEISKLTYFNQYYRLLELQKSLETLRESLDEQNNILGSYSDILTTKNAEVASAHTAYQNALSELEGVSETDSNYQTLLNAKNSALTNLTQCETSLADLNTEIGGVNNIISTLNTSIAEKSAESSDLTIKYDALKRGLKNKDIFEDENPIRGITFYDKSGQRVSFMADEISDSLLNADTEFDSLTLSNFHPQESKMTNFICYFLFGNLIYTNTTENTSVEFGGRLSMDVESPTSLETSSGRSVNAFNAGARLIVTTDNDGGGSRRNAALEQG